MEGAPYNILEQVLNVLLTKQERGSVSAEGIDGATNLPLLLCPIDEEGVLLCHDHHKTAKKKHDGAVVLCVACASICLCVPRQST